MEDEGTPPAVHDGFLLGETSPSYTATQWQSRLWQHGSARPRRLNSKFGTKASAQEADGSATAVDLIKLLEENWFWRSSTASPTMALEDRACQSTHAKISANQSLSNDQWTPMGSDARTRVLQLEEASSTESTGENVNPQSTDRRQEGNQGTDDFADGLKRTSLASQVKPLMSRKSQSADLDSISADGSHPGRLPQNRITSVPPHLPERLLHSAQRVSGGKEVTDIELDAIDTIGTWGHRVLRFKPEHKSSSPTHIPGTPDESELQPRSARTRRRTTRGGPPERRVSIDEEAAAVNAAWRWRFNRRWRTEQAKQLDPDFGLDGDGDDGWDDALGYLEACGPGVQHQIARTTSLEQTLASASLASNGSEAAHFLVDNSQRDKGALRIQADMDATKKVSSVARKAQDLFRQQQKIEKDVKARWGSSQFRMSWAGQQMKAVQVDTYGVFKFVLVRVSDRTSAHRLLVRGRNSAGVDETMREVINEANTTSKNHQMPQLSVVLIGSGVVSWGLGQDRKVNFSAGHAEKGNDPNIRTSDDVCRLAGALTRTSMPAPTQVTVNGKRLS